MNNLRHFNPDSSHELLALEPQHVLDLLSTRTTRCRIGVVENLIVQVHLGFLPNPAFQVE